MTMIQKAIALIREYEGLRLMAYIPPEGTHNGYAIGYGYTRPWVDASCVISERWAEELLMDELRPAGAYLTLFSLNANQEAALLSFIYNVGLRAFKESTLHKCLLRRDFASAAEEFLRWTKAGAKELPGLVRRRTAERALFITPVIGEENV